MEQKKALKIKRIYGYKNPFEIELMPEWSELKKYPHLCVSQTLVEGLKEYYGRSGFQLLCTVDMVLKKFYEDWHDSTENNILQGTLVDNLLRTWEVEKKEKGNLIRTIRHNKQDFIKSLRMLIESDIIDRSEVIATFSEEQQLLMEAYHVLKEHKAFSYLKTKHKRWQLDYVYVEVVKDEIKKYLKHYNQDKDLLSHTQLLRELDTAKDRLKKEIGYCKRQLEKNNFDSEEEKEEMKVRKERSQKKYNSIPHLRSVFERYKDYETIDIDTDKVVLHGIHQFTPLILRFIRDLNAMGVEVIAIFNYMSEYPEIYKTWETVYQWTGESITERGNGYQEPRKLGEAFGKIFEKDFSALEKPEEKYYMFDHLTSFSDYVGDRYDEATEKFDKIFGKKQEETGEQEGVENEKLIKIALMNEQFYAINGSEVNELLKIYFPEQFSSRHFLTYPVGQFILSLYNMWDDQEETMRIQQDHIKEALALDIWRRDGMPTPLDMFHNLAPYFEKETTFGGYLKRLSKLKKVANEAKDKRIKRMSFYIYEEKELEYFEKVLEEILKIARSIFATKQDNLKDNFQKLLSGIQTLISTPSAEERVSKEELHMLKLIQSRLENLEDGEETAYVSTIKGTIGYYIQASTSKEYEAEWIVRDFEQIDGGILLAAAQKRDQGEQKGSKVFHYAGVSDENLLGRAKKELPWPLTTKMYAAFKNQIATICATCRAQYNYFLRYSLFYGTYFLKDNKKICLSYIKELGDDEANPYSILSQIMRLEPEDYVCEILKEEWDEELYYETEGEVQVTMPPDDSSERRSMQTCSMRYLWNHCLDIDTYYDDPFQLEKIGKFFVEYSYLDQKQQDKQIDYFDQKIFNNYMKYLPIFDGTDCREIEATIKKQLDSGNKHKESYINDRMEFMYRDWDKIEKSKVKMLNGFREWVINTGEEGLKGNCRDCNQRHICYILDEDEE